MRQLARPLARRALDVDNACTRADIHDQDSTLTEALAAARGGAMSIFLCWSGDRSHELAKATRTLVCAALNTKDVFVSDQIEKGVAWFDSIVTNLQKAAVGIVCLTAENTESPWLHFEAGALASPRDRRWRR